MTENIFSIIIPFIGTVLGGNWNNDTILTTTDGEIYTYESIKLNANEQFKLRLNLDWTTSWGYSNVDSASSSNFKNEGGNIKVVNAGTYSVKFVMSTSTITLTAI